ncbi:MAG: molecular chaperone DnaK, partial [Deltaproteobacteria bacterium]|nr:molecular chaperone DnaK [Deltaproteobacteria bacterium]
DNIESIKSITEELEKLSHSIAESIYKKTAAETGTAGTGAGTGEEQQSKPADDNVVEAEYEEVKDKKNE